MLEMNNQKGSGDLSCEIFTVSTKLAGLAPNDLTTAKKVTSCGTQSDAIIITGLGVQSLTN